MKRQAEKMDKVTDIPYATDTSKSNKWGRPVSGNRSAPDVIHRNANRSTHPGLYIPNPEGFYNTANYGINRGTKGGKTSNARKSFLFTPENDQSYDFQRLDHDAIDYLFGFKPGYTDIGKLGELIDLHKAITPNFALTKTQEYIGKDGKRHKRTIPNPNGGMYFTDSTANTDRQRKLGNTYTVQQIWQQMHRLFPNEIRPPSDYRLKDFVDYDKGAQKTHNLAAAVNRRY
jgi:hypothetical protein